MSHRLSILPIASILLPALLVAACIGPGATPTPTPIPPAPSSNPIPSTAPSGSPVPGQATATLLLKITSEGGFIAASANLAALPSVAVYTDGRIITPGVVPAIYPGPLVPIPSVRDVGPAGAAEIEAAIRTAGLDKPATGSPGVPGDTGTTVFTVLLDGQTTTSRFANLGGAPGPQPGGSQDPGRAAASDLLDRLNDQTTTWGGSAGTTTTYTPTGYRIFVAPGAPQADPSLSQSPVQWPLSTPLAVFGTPAVPDRGVAGLRTGVVLGPDVATLAPVLASASALTPWESGGSSYTLYVRPLLPDESGG
jgi:hypothetical protein